MENSTNITEDFPLDVKIPLEICPAPTTVALVFTLLPTVSILLAVVFGNLLVIFGFFRERSLRTAPNFYLVSLAFVDLFVGIFILPLNIQNHVRGCWTLGKTLCKIYSTLDITLCVMSILHLCAIAWDRYRAIKDGVRYIQTRSLNSVLSTILGIAITSLWISSPPILGWDPTWLEDLETKKECYLVDHVGYRFYSAFGALFLPFLLMLMLYTKIYFAIRERLRSKFPQKIEEESEENFVSGNSENIRVSLVDPLKRKETKGGGKSSHSTLPRRNSKLSEFLKDFMAKKEKFSLTKERRASRTLGVIIGSFFVCWMPFALMYVLVPFLEYYWSLEPPAGWIFEFLTWLGYLNSALNPIIYGVCNSEFRDAFKKVLGL